MATRTARRNGGFTLLEVMFGLALLGLGLTVLIKSAASNIFNAQQAHLMGVVTDLARGKMYDIEEKLLKDGFSDTEQHEEDQSFEEEGWPAIHYSYKIELVELPNFDSLQAIMQGSGSAGSSGSGAGGDKAGSGDSSSGGGGGPAGAFGDSMLGGMLSQFGGLGGSSGSRGGAGGKGGDINASIGSSFIQSQYSMFQEILKVTIRKVTLTVNWQVMGHDRDMKVVQFLTDAGSMDKVLQGIGSKDLDTGSGSGSSGTGGAGGAGGGSGRGSSSGGTPSGGTGGGRGTPTAGQGGR